MHIKSPSLKTGTGSTRGSTLVGLTTLSQAAGFTHPEGLSSCGSQAPSGSPLAGLPPPPALFKEVIFLTPLDHRLNILFSVLSLAIQVLFVNVLLTRCLPLSRG